ncbi:MAG: Fe-S cluster assembly protein SufD [Fidelibacterota bacterium]
MSLFQSHFESLLNVFPAQGPELLALRKRSYQRFQELGLPNRKWEDWQFTNFTPLKKESFNLEPRIELPEKLSYPAPVIAQSNHLVILNGHFQNQWSQLPPGIKIRDFPGSPLSDSVAVPEPDDQNPFKALNSALMTTNLVVNIPAHTSLKIPIHILYSTTESDKPTMNHSRIKISLGTGSSATIYEHFLGSTDERYWNNLVTRLEVGEQASLDHVVIVEEGPKAYHIAANDYILSRNSRLKSFQYCVGGKLNRRDLRLSLNGRDSEAELYGLTLSRNHQHIDLHVVVDHLKPACNSRQTFKNILADQSTGVFNGRVIVNPGSQKTDARQENKNLLLSDQTLMHSNPQLEIYADDVKCAHGSSSGELDDEALFYLRTRGIRQQTARQLIVRGFASELFTNLPGKELKIYFDSILTNWLKSVYSSDN